MERNPGMIHIRSKGFLVFLSLSAVVSMFIFRHIVFAQPVPPPPSDPDAERNSRAKQGMEYMKSAQDKIMTGTQTKKLLSEKAASESSQKISLELRNINVVDVLKILSQTGGINIVAGPSVRGNTTIFLQDVNVWDALRIILEINNLAYIQDGEILKVISEKEYQDIYGVPFHDTTLTRVFKLKHAKAEDVNTALNNVKSTKGKVIIDERTNTLIVLETPDAMKAVVKVVEELDKLVVTRVYQLKYTTPATIETLAKDIITKKGMIQTDPLTNKIIITDTPETLGFIETIIQEYDTKPYTTTATYYLKFASYEDIEPKVKDLLTKDVGIVISDKRTNSLVITDYPDKINDIVSVIESLDTIHREVLIDCKIFSVILNDDFAMGIDFEKIFSQGSKEAFGLEQQLGASLGTLPTPGLPAISEPAGFNTTGSGAGGIFTVGKVDDMRAVISALKQVGKTKLLSEPRLTVMNNEEAQIQVGSDEPFVTSSSTLNTATTSIAEDVQFIEVGVLLSVTPTINDHGYVTMKIKPEVSQVQRFVITAQSNSIPVVETSQLETTVMVKDQYTIVLGGLIKDTHSKNENRIPILGSIPVLGIPFRSNRATVSQQELLVFLTPRIISGERNMFDPQYSRASTREFIHQLDKQEIKDQKNFEQYLRDEKMEEKTQSIKARVDDLEHQLKMRKEIEERKKKKKFLGMF